MRAAIKCAQVVVLSMLFAGSARASVIYEFSGTGVSFGPIQVAFRLTVPDFVDPPMDGASEFRSCGQLDSSTNCLPVFPGGVYFSNQSAGGAYSAQLQFNASNNAGYVFVFPTGAFGTPGTYTAHLLGPNGNPGELRVVESTDVPEPAAMSLLGLAAVLLRRRVRSRVRTV
jgi:MYXO-CTERM domain-containing protein